MGTYYIKGGSKYNEANPKVWVTLFLGGFDDSKYTDANWKSIDYDFGGAGSVVTVQDPFWRLGGSSGGVKELELGLWNDYRIKFETTGITYWDGDGWEDLLAEGGAGQLSDLSDVSNVVYTSGYVLRANGSGYVSTQLSHGDLSDAPTSAHHVKTVSSEILLASMSEKDHVSLTNKNAETDVKHLTDAQLGALHTIYSLEVHNNDYHDPDYLVDPILLTERAEPDTPAANTLKLYAFDESGYTTLRFIEPNGNVIIIGECMYKIGRNTSGVEIAKGKIVYFNGTTTGKHPNFSLAKADSLTTMPAIGITCDVVANNAWARLMIMGRFTGLNTPWVNGTILYVSSTVAGGYANTFPPSPLIDQQIGIVEVNHAVTGVLLVDFRQMQGRNDGTIRQSFNIGDGVSGDVTLAFNGDVGNDGSIVWDVSEDEFVFNYPINGHYTKDEVDGLLHTRLHAITDVLDHSANNWKVFYSNGAGQVIELALGADGEILTSTGATTAPAFEAVGAADNLGNHIATEALAMATFKITGMGNPTANQDAATKIFVESYADSLIPYTASDTLQFSNDTERTSISLEWVKLKQITCHISGNIRLYWEHMRDVGSESGGTRIYLNDVAVSTTRGAIESYTSETYDLVIHTSDQLQIWGYATKAAGPPYADKIWAKNMRIKYTENFVSDS